MDWVIIMNAEKLVEPLELKQWETYEWDSFDVLRNEDGDRRWFDEKGEAITYIQENFEEDEISPEYCIPKGYGKDGNQYFK